MVHLLINWLLSALALWMVSRIISGVQVRDFGAALIATVAIAVVNMLIGVPLRILTFPLTVVTLGLFLLVLNAFLLKLSSLFVPGFAVRGFVPAFFGSIVLTILHYVMHHMVF